MWLLAEFDCLPTLQAVHAITLLAVVDSAEKNPSGQATHDQTVEI
ncbi:hypothetical protein [Silvimonas sp.]|nr:hypothetical protein [Silvimonas sp.]MDR3426063.1 hypothetical protein [Silvimonas sp.]